MGLFHSKASHGRVVELPEDIIEKEILPRLPPKCVIRNKCVCKRWLSLISTSKQFVKMNLHYVYHSVDKHKHKLLLCDFRGGYTYQIYSCAELHPSSRKQRYMPFTADPKNIKILATLDGLVCVGIRKINQLVFWNPLTGVYKNLSKTYSPRFYSLQKDAIGFYFDSSNDDYRLLQVVMSGRLGAYIYSNKSDSWRKIECLENLHPDISNCRWSHATYVGETLYFAVRDACIIGGQCWIVSFDVKSETFREVKFPPIPSSQPFCESLVVVNGSIHLCVSYANGISFDQLDNFQNGRSGLTSLEYSEGELWRMESDDMWVKVKTFSRKKHKLINYKFICVTRNGDWHMITEYEDRLRKLDLEDLATNFCINYHGNWVASFPRIIFVETLVSPYT